MKFTAAVLISLLPVLASANPQYNYPPPAGNGGAATSTTSASNAAVSAPPSENGQFNINVAFQGNLVFNPSNITAPKGSNVTFFFPSGGLAHSVTQSTFAAPCTPLSGNGTGFDSGLTTGAQFTITIEDESTPIWFFCKAPSHCGLGMVGSINAPSSGNTYDNFLSAAKQIGSSEPTVQDNGPVTGGVGAVATAGPTSGGASTSATSTSSGSAVTTTTSGAGRVVAGGSAALIVLMAASVFIA